MDEKTITREPPPVSTGIEGLDDILRGGLTPDRLYLIEGEPGAGKTTLALQFLLDGARRGEASLYVSLSETKAELLATSRSHGWDLNPITIVELTPQEEALSPDSQLTMFHPSELELSETTKRILAEVERIKPKRIVLDSLSEVRLLAQNALRYRRQILALKHFFVGRNCTVLLLDDRTASMEDQQLHSIVHGVILLEQLATEYGAERRRLRVKKLRGVGFRGGFHDYLIRRGGLAVFPRLIAGEHHTLFDEEAVVPSGVAALDTLLGGGIPMGTSTLLMGPAGTGKSSVAVQFAVAAAERNQRSAIFLFDESLATVRTRTKKLGIKFAPFAQSGHIKVEQVDPAELSPGEFAAKVRRAVDEVDDTHRPLKVVIIDSLNGYLNSMPEERFLTSQLHELLAYLGQKGVITLLLVAQHGLVGGAMNSPIDTSYLADNVILFRYFEAEGHVRRAVSVVKKRSGEHELTIREMTMGAGGIALSEPLSQFQGVLTGVPTIKRRQLEEPHAGV
jgi:circadian clock protein KaiC